MEDDILYVGSVKTVIGHTGGAAGLAGLLKACMALKYRTIPPNLHFNKLNPRIKYGVPQRASVNSFGLAYDEFQRVIRPKVDGTIYLDSLLAENNLELLDWFILFSSFVATSGNPGQCNYVAANCFMKTFVKNRRARGLTGSSIDISRIVGVGYLKREMRSEGRPTKEQKQRLTSGSMGIPISETDVHHLFAEAVVAGRPGSNADPEIITGIAPVRREDANMNQWPGNPMFGLLVKEGDEVVVDTSLQTARLPVKVLLEAAKSDEEIMNILNESLSDKVRRALFMSASDILTATLPLLDVGVDSLIAVKIRAWFLKELSVDVPVMRILGGASIEDLSEYCLAQMQHSI